MFYQHSYVGEGDLILAGWQGESEFHSTAIWRCLMDCTVLGIATLVLERNLGNAPTRHSTSIRFTFSGDEFGLCLTRRLYRTTGGSLSEYRKYARFLHGNWRSWMTSMRLKVKYRGYTYILKKHKLHCCRKEIRHGNKVQPVDTIGCPSTRDHYIMSNAADSSGLN
jgi:hypothetical protein